MSEPDWYSLVAGGGPCPECGLDVNALDRSDLGPEILGEARRWEDALVELAHDEEAMRRRPAPDVWSAIEYAGHVAGVFAVFAGRVRQVRLEHSPELGWWDQDAAVTDDRYAERTVDEARAAIADGAVALALALPRLDDPDSWRRDGTRRGTERFTVEGLARFALHESTHHRLDAYRSAN
jgi:hypothetical protein